MIADYNSLKDVKFRLPNTALHYDSSASLSGELTVFPPTHLIEDVGYFSLFVSMYSSFGKTLSQFSFA